MFNYMFGSYVKKSHKKEGDKHNDTKQLNLKEFVYIGKSLEKSFDYTIRPITLI